MFVLLLLANLVLNFQGLKVFEFSTSLQDKSRVTIINDAPTPENFTLCMDFYSRLDTYRRLLKSRESSDIEILIDTGGFIIYVKVAGIWYLAVPESPGWVDSVKWETICTSYNSKTQAVTVGFRNSIIFTEEKIIPNRTLSGKFLKDLTLGEKDSAYHFAGDITRVNIWSKVLDLQTLKNITNCGSSNYDELPDILNWDTVEVTVEGGVLEKDIDEYPCTSGSNDVHDILMPESADSMYEAIKTCKVLGGNLHFPFQEDEVSPFLDKVKLKLAESECDTFIWSKYYKNEYADNNWTVYESESTYWYPPFEYAGWLDFAIGQPNGKHFQSCAGISLDQYEPNLVYDLDCSDSGYCYMCRLKSLLIKLFSNFSFTHRFTEITYFGLRGLCIELAQMIDQQFIVDIATISRNIEKGIEFTGLTKTKIVLDKKTNRWTVVLLKDGSTIMSLDSEVFKTI